MMQPHVQHALPRGMFPTTRYRDARVMCHMRPRVPLAPPPPLKRRSYDKQASFIMPDSPKRLSEWPKLRHAREM